jgi:putative copper resistance protein D
MDVAVRALHLIAAAVWAGGLVFLGVAAGVARATIPEGERIEFFRRLGRRFLVVAFAAAAVLAATGVDMASDHLASWSALADTGWGRLITAKTTLFATALVLASIHGFVLGPRIRRLREVRLTDPGDPAPESELRRIGAISGVIQVVILAETVAILVLAADLVA